MEWSWWKSMKIKWICPHVDSILTEGAVLGEPVHSWTQWSRVLDDCEIVYGRHFVPSTDTERFNECDVVIIIGGEHAGKLLLDMREHCDHPKILLAQDGCIDIFNRMKPQFREQNVKAIKACDGFLTFHHRANSFYRLLTDKPIEWVGVPIPDEIKECRKPISERDRDLFIIGTRIYSSLNRGGITALMLAKSFAGSKVDIMGDGRDEKYARLSGDMSGVEFHPPIDQAEYIKRVAKGFISIYLDKYGSVGRVNGDMALLGIPCITTAKSSNGVQLFPDLIVDPEMEVDKALELIARLREDASFYTHCVDYADKILTEKLGNAPARKRFYAVMENFNGG
ncbi:MAG: hypothetical protein U9N14_06170 [Pseudomonadota bacterium]|nr:hypothetical protein [Pseudomonadota bacterium]